MAEQLLVKFPVDLKPKYYAAIGEIAARWSWLEFHFHVIIRVILGLGKKEGRILTIGMGMRPMANMIRGLAFRWVNDVALRRDLQKFAKDVLSSKKARDTYIHGVYCHPPSHPEAIGIYYMRSPEEKIMPTADLLPLEELTALANKFRGYQDQATDLIHRLKALPRTRA